MHRFLVAPLFLSLLSAAPAPGGPIRLVYEIDAAGLKVAELRASLDMEPSGYRARMEYETTGLFRLLFRTDIANTVRGSWQGDNAAPAEFAAAGSVGGQQRRTLIAYRDGDPQVRELDPPNNGERQPVPPALEAHTIDTLSAIVGLIHRVALTARCDDQATTFDGRRLIRISSRTAGEQRILFGSDAARSGTALRCDFQGLQIAGFKRDDSGYAHRPHHGSAWFGTVAPGVPALPVRVSFETRWFGDAVATLTRVEAPGAAAVR